MRHRANAHIYSPDGKGGPSSGPQAASFSWGVLLLAALDEDGQMIIMRP